MAVLAPFNSRCIWLSDDSTLQIRHARYTWLASDEYYYRSDTVAAKNTHAATGRSRAHVGMLGAVAYTLLSFIAFGLTKTHKKMKML